MDKKLSNAFTYMFKDPDWKYKFLILIVLFIPASYLAYLIYSTGKEHMGGNTPQMIGFWVLSILASFFSVGYFATITNKLINSNQNEPICLPDWETNFGGYFVLGLKKSFAIFLFYVIPVLALCTVPLFKFLGIGALIGSIFILFIPAIIAFIIFLLLLFPLDKIFCTNFSITSYFCWKQAKDIIVKNPSIYFLVILLAVLLSSPQSMFLSLKPPMLLVVIACPIFGAYVGFVHAYLIALLGEKEQKSIATD